MFEARGTEGAHLQTREQMCRALPRCCRGSSFTVTAARARTSVGASHWPRGLEEGPPSPAEQALASSAASTWGWGRRCSLTWGRISLQSRPAFHRSASDVPMVRIDVPVVRNEARSPGGAAQFTSTTGEEWASSGTLMGR